MRMFSCACIALIVLAPLQARAEMYESIKACTASGVMRLGCFVIQKGVEVYIEKTVTEWYTAWRDGDKPKPGSSLDSVAEDYRRRLSERAAAGRKGEQQLRGDLVDFNTLMLDVDAKVGPDRNISNATLATKFTQRCRTGDASGCAR